MSKKVQLEGNFGGSREDVYPATMAEIVYTQDGKNLEEKMNETNAQLSDINLQLNNNSKITNKRIEVMNEVNDIDGVFDLANFAGQGTDLRDIMCKLHNYTDSDLMWLDNVGENNTILRLNNSRNPIRRPDKSDSFVGSGNYLVCGKHKEDGSVYHILFEIDENMNFNFNNAGAIEFVNNKLNSDGEPAFIIKTPSGTHRQVLKIQTGVNNKELMTFGCHASGVLAELEIGEEMTNGLNIVFPNIDQNQHLKFGVANNPYTVPNIMIKGYAPTGTTPQFIGQMFVNTIDKSVYMATEIVSGGWTKLSN